MTDTDAPIARLLASYQAAAAAKDVAAFMRLYDPHVRVFDTWGVWSYDGAAAWQVAVEGWFTSLGTDTVHVSFDGVTTLAGRDLSIVSAFVGYAAVSAQGAPLRSMHNRLTWALKTSGHVLRIVHEHTSAPIGFDDATAMLQRAGASGHARS